jgi:hypothetical protein
MAERLRYKLSIQPVQVLLIVDTSPLYVLQFDNNDNSDKMRREN